MTSCAVADGHRWIPGECIPWRRQTPRHQIQSDPVRSGQMSDAFPRLFHGSKKHIFAQTSWSGLPRFTLPNQQQQAQEPAKVKPSSKHDSCFGVNPETDAKAASEKAPARTSLSPRLVANESMGKCECQHYGQWITDPI